MRAPASGAGSPTWRGCAPFWKRRSRAGDRAMYIRRRTSRDAIDVEELMHSSRLRRAFALSATLGMVSLIVGVIGVGIAIRYGAVAPPPLEVRLYTIHILAYRTDYPECPPTTVCPFESIETPPAYFVIWTITELARAHQPYSRT